VPKAELTRLKNSVKDLPSGKKVSDKVYEANMPRKFQELMLRVYSRSLEKANLILSATEEYIEGEWKGYEINGISHHTPTKPAVPLFSRKRRSSAGRSSSGGGGGRRKRKGDDEVYNGQLSQETYCADDDEDAMSGYSRSSIGGIEEVSDLEVRWSDVR